MRSHSPARTFASAADLAACGASLRGGSRTFFAASLALPRHLRRSATGLYAFCRAADDAIDHGTDRHAALLDLRERLDDIYSGRPAAFPADRAFADVVLRHDIPKAFPLALFEGFEWDAMNRRYETFERLLAYAVRVAGVVGAMMAMLMGVRRPALIARACDLGVAMQLTNIARDIGEDARSGRLYLPMDWLDDAGIDAAAWSAAPVFTPALATVVKRLLVEADAFYARSDSGLACLPPACRPGMYAARLLYAEIGHELCRRRLDSVNHRAVVPWQRKARLLADAAVAARGRAAPDLDGDVLPQAHFLLDSLPAQPASPGIDERAPVRERVARRGVRDRVIWVVNLFERLERLERRERSASVVSGVP